MNVKRFLTIVTVAMAVLPLPVKYVPEWKVQMVRRDGSGIAERTVKQEYYYSNVLGSNEEINRTDRNGFVTYPARWAYYPPLFHLVILASNFLGHITLGEPLYGAAKISTRDENFYRSVRYVNGQSEPLAETF